MNTAAAIAPICPARWCLLLANPQFPCLRDHHRPQQAPRSAKPATILAISSLSLPSPPLHLSGLTRYASISVAVSNLWPRHFALSLPNRVRPAAARRRREVARIEMGLCKLLLFDRNGEAGTLDDAMRIYKKMIQSGIKPTIHTL
ncbi:Pentatricopeptide repeat [Sesbania bispinosa]|nr:Pentatricopeptide repeat [Sesbania bispinosa]